ncbi:hypothetical protein GCM10020000_39740 [Streptomyces olivoverticillatus]
MHLHDFWFWLIAVLWTGYFFLEGFDFGIGVLTKALAKDRTERRVLINTIGPVWDANEVWLITAIGATFAAFPDWYATLLSGFYLPMLAVLVCLIVRGVAFEYRHKRTGERWQRNWEHAIFWCSLLPAFLWGADLRRHRARRADRPGQGLHRRRSGPADPVRTARRCLRGGALHLPRSRLRRAQDRRRHPPPGQGLRRPVRTGGSASSPWPSSAGPRPSRATGAAWRRWPWRRSPWPRRCSSTGPGGKAGRSPSPG